MELYQLFVINSLHSEIEIKEEFLAGFINQSTNLHERII